MNDIKVSVIIPVYNAEAHLQECLDSVIAQTLKEIEIICIDDGSTDGSPAILNNYAAKDDRITVVRQENAGAGAARNNGLRHAHGTYLSFLDADDFFEPTMLEEAYACAECYKADVVVFNSDQYYENTDEYKEVSWVVRYAEMPPYQPFNRRALTDNVFKVFVGWTWDKLFDRQFVLDNDLWFQEQRTTNDMLFVFSAIALAKRIAYVEHDHILAHQRRTTQDSLSKTREQSWDCFYKALIALRDRLQAEGIYQELEKDYINYALHAVLWNLNSLAEPSYSELLVKLKEQWLDDLGIAGRDQTYFYNKQEFEQYRKLLTQ